MNEEETDSGDGSSIDTLENSDDLQENVEVVSYEPENYARSLEGGQFYSMYDGEYGFPSYNCPFEAKEIISVVIISMNTPQEFYVNKPIDSQTICNGTPMHLKNMLCNSPFKDLMKKMNTYYQLKRDEIKKYNVYVGYYVAAYDENTDLWYRAEILQCLTDEVQVLLVDFGVKTCVKYTNLKKLLRKFCQLDIQVTRCMIDCDTGGGYSEKTELTLLKASLENRCKLEIVEIVPEGMLVRLLNPQVECEIPDFPLSNGLMKMNIEIVNVRNYRVFARSTQWNHPVFGPVFEEYMKMIEDIEREAIWQYRLSNLYEGLICLLQDENSVYHRVEVLSKLTETIAALYYVDSGEIAIKHISSLYEIKESWKKVPRFCFSFIVRNMQNKYVSWKDNKVFQDLYQHLLDSTKLHVLKIQERNAEEIFIGEIYEENGKTFSYNKFMN